MSADSVRQSVVTAIQQAIDARIVREELYVVQACDLDTESMAEDIAADLGVEQVGWRQDNGSFCFGHDHHHRLDGVKWCEPVYRFARTVDQ